MLQEIKNHNVIFNCHANIATEATNMRMFEVCGVGSLLITDHFSKSPFTFDDCLIYHSKASLINRIEYALYNPSIVLEIAQHGHETVLNHHTVEHRAKVFNQLLYEGIK